MRSKQDAIGLPQQPSFGDSLTLDWYRTPSSTTATSRATGFANGTRYRHFGRRSAAEKGVNAFLDISKMSRLRHLATRIKVEGHAPNPALIMM